MGTAPRAHAVAVGLDEKRMNVGRVGTCFALASGSLAAAASNFWFHCPRASKADAEHSKACIRRLISRCSCLRLNNVLDAVAAHDASRTR